MSKNCWEFSWFPSPTLHTHHRPACRCHVCGWSSRSAGTGTSQCRSAALTWRSECCSCSWSAFEWSLSQARTWQPLPPFQRLFYSWPNGNLYPSSGSSISAQLCQRAESSERACPSPKPPQLQRYHLWDKPVHHFQMLFDGSLKQLTKKM